MKTKGKAESIISSTNMGSNKKRDSEIQDGDNNPEGSLLKKNEYAMILFGALALTIIVFFFFFRSSDSKTETVNSGASTASLADLEKRIENMEQAFQSQEKPETGKAAESASAVDPVEERLARLETAFSVKFDSLSERMEKIEKTISLLSAQPAKPSETTKPAVSEKKAAVPVKKAVKKEKATDMFHTVQKGETLYSIAKKYNTSVEALRKLNNLSAKDNIYIGNNILIR